MKLLDNKSYFNFQVPTFLAQYPPKIWNIEQCCHLQAIYNLDTEIAEFARTHQMLSSKDARVKDLVKNHWDNNIHLINKECWLALLDRYLCVRLQITVKLLSNYC